MTRVAVIYYSASGNVHALSQAVADGADKVATTFTSSQTAHGGQESTILALKRPSITGES